MRSAWVPPLQDLAARHGGVTLYLFGSTARGSNSPNDLDLLAVYDTLENLDNFLLELDKLDVSSLVDLVAMTPSELRASRFLLRSEAIPVGDLTDVQLTSRHTLE